MKFGNIRLPIDTGGLDNPDNPIHTVYDYNYDIQPIRVTGGGNGGGIMFDDMGGGVIDCNCLTGTPRMVNGVCTCVNNTTTGGVTIDAVTPTGYPIMTVQNTGNVNGTQSNLLGTFQNAIQQNPLMALAIAGLIGYAIFKK